MISKKFNKRKNYKAYSFLEVLISLLIVGFCTVVMMNFMIMSFRLSAIALGRSVLREELSSIMTQINRDFRSADLVPLCDDSEGLSCDFYIEGILYK